MKFSIKLYELKAAFLCASTDETRLILTHVLVDLEAEKKPKLVGTDGCSLLLIESNEPPVKETAQVLIPRRMLLLLERISRTDRPVLCDLQDGKLSMDGGGVGLSCPHPEGIFPKYQQVIPPTDEGKMDYVNINPKLVARVGEAAHLVAKSHDRNVFLSTGPRSPALVIKQKAELGPYRITVGLMPEFLGVIMPTRPL